jgi:hypothetical protein
VCVNAFCTLLAISKNRLYPHAHIDVAQKGRKVDRDKRSNTIAWLFIFLDDQGQSNPRTHEIHLTRQVPRKLVWELMQKEQQSKPVYSYPQYVISLFHLCLLIIILDLRNF